ncbi:MAG TPA: ATP-binding protein, partial [Candidatus Sulfotelmatobacter sp.]|nr:ATP-binding protein [Candidatus Sulfotelmatobacter sp.]
NLVKLFTKFYQVDSTYTRATGGVGLGLAIAKDIVETHGGRIQAESPGLGHGTTIRFTLPISG